MLQAGQNLLINDRQWHIRGVTPLEGRNLKLEVIGVSAAVQGMTRHLLMIQYGPELFIVRRGQGYWHSHLEQDWLEEAGHPVLVCRPANGLDLLAVHTRYLASGRLKNEFSWSYSRAAKYNECPRAYYYHYYAAWEGWQLSAPAPVKQAYLLKNLTSLSYWTGDLVHKAIQFALTSLKAGHPVTKGDLIGQMHRRAQADFSDSRSGRYRQKPNQLTGFQEHYYGLKLPKATWQAAWNKIEQRIGTFMDSDLYAELCRQPTDTFLAVEKLQEFYLKGTKVWVQMDLVQRKGDTIQIYDWKSGRIDKQAHRQQLGIYGLYARQAWPEAAGHKLKGLVYDLAENRLLQFDLDDTLLEQTRVSIEISINSLQGLLLDPETNLAEMRRFPMINDLAVCGQCQFRVLCGRE